AAYLHSRISEAFGVDVHPAARLGSGILIDHGTGVVIGETAVVEDNVSLLHEGRLGGTGKEAGARHPKDGRGGRRGGGGGQGVGTAAGGGGGRGAGRGVLREVPPQAAVAGVPAGVVGGGVGAAPALTMDQTLPREHEDGGGI